MLSNRIRDFCLLTCVLAFIQAIEWQFSNASITPYLLILTGIATLAKGAQISLHTAPTIVSSLVGSSTIVVAGTILCIEPNLLYFLLYIRYFTSLHFRLIAFYEKDPKNILAYSTVSQSALVIFIICTNIKVLILMHIIIHALPIALLFIRIIIFTIFMFGNPGSRLLDTTESLLPRLTTSVICLLIMCEESVISLIMLNNFCTLCLFGSSSISASSLIQQQYY
ncbi:NADH dehydrogenase subunit 5 [Trichuris trichiura]|uniref:NADH:ubiquinone reductase (H(+)-translocating) n=1 Tax=Trichuris trichiura TaxID=36087 RepID=A0A077ZQ97_TRITR|nr:NADH dehydrogenase subunit 5 [Trichuris trichiura]